MGFGGQIVLWFLNNATSENPINPPSPTTFSATMCCASPPSPLVFTDSTWTIIKTDSPLPPFTYPHGNSFAVDSLTAFALEGSSLAYLASSPNTVSESSDNSFAPDSPSTFAVSSPTEFKLQP